MSIKWYWWIWLFVVSILLWIIIIGSAAKIANAYELDVADKRVPLPTHDWRFLQQQCDDFNKEEYGLVGCAYMAAWDDDNGHGIDLEVHLPKGMGASGYWHETAHLFDFTVLTDAHRAEFLRLVGRVGDDWWEDIPDDRDGVLYNYDPPGEWFADAYSLCALRATGRRKLVGASEVVINARGTRILWRYVKIRGEAYGYEVRWPVHQRVCQLIGNATGMHYDRKTGSYS